MRRSQEKLLQEILVRTIPSRIEYPFGACWCIKFSNYSQNGPNQRRMHWLAFMDVFLPQNRPESKLLQLTGGFWGEHKCLFIGVDWKFGWVFGEHKVHRGVRKWGEQPAFSHEFGDHMFVLWNQGWDFGNVCVRSEWEYQAEIVDSTDLLSRRTFPLFLQAQRVWANQPAFGYSLWIS